MSVASCCAGVNVMLVCFLKKCDMITFLILIFFLVDHYATFS